MVVGGKRGRVVGRVRAKREVRRRTGSGKVDRAEEGLPVEVE